MSLDIWEKVRGHWTTDLQIPLPTLLPRMGSPSPASSYSWGPGMVDACLFLQGWLWFPATYRMLQPSQSHPRLRTSGHPPSYYYKVYLLQPLVVCCVPDYSSHVALQGTVQLRSCGQSPLSGVGFCVFSYNPRKETLPSPMEWRAGHQNESTVDIELKFCFLVCLLTAGGWEGNGILATTDTNVDYT